MNLLDNLIDNILECGVKLGPCNTSMTFYYPLSSLYELLNCDETSFDTATAAFKSEVSETLGEISIKEVKSEPGRFGVKVSPRGVAYVTENFKASDFTKAFISAITDMEVTVDKIIALFKSYDSEVVVKRENDHEFAVYFASGEVDPYVYFLEENDFGLEYPRYTRFAYEMAMHSDHE